MKKEDMKPVSPKEALKRQREKVPPIVVSIFNDLIVENLKSGRAEITTDQFLAELQAREEGLVAVFDSINILYIEEIFREVGWEVNYLDSVFCFSKGYN